MSTTAFLCRSAAYALHFMQVIPELEDDLLDLFRRRMEHNLKYAQPEDRKHWYSPCIPSAPVWKHPNRECLPKGPDVT